MPERQFCTPNGQIAPPVVLGTGTGLGQMTRDTTWKPGRMLIRPPPPPTRTPSGRSSIRSAPPVRSSACPATAAGSAAFGYWFSGPGRRVFVAEDAGRIVGTSYLRPNQGGGGSHVANAGYATAPAAQGRGIARALLAHSLETARAAGFRAMQFNFVVATNTRAVATWEAAGFAVVGRLPGAFEHPREGAVDALVMHRSL